jgi:hypothetical protein
MTKDNLPQVATGTEAIEQAMDTLPALSTDDVVERTLSRTMNATTAEDVLADPGAVGLADYVGRVIELVAVAGVLPSRYDSGLSRYVVMDIVDPDTGEKVSVTVGSTYIISRALKLAQLGALPCKVRVLELESASNPGQSSLWIVKP